MGFGHPDRVIVLPSRLPPFYPGPSGFRTQVTFWVLIRLKETSRDVVLGAVPIIRTDPGPQEVRNGTDDHRRTSGP